VSINSVFYWDAPFGGAKVLLGTNGGIYQLRVVDVLSGGPGGSHDYFDLGWSKLVFSSSTFETSWLYQTAPNFRFGKFVPYGKYLYYCDGVGFPLRIRGYGYNMEPMGVGTTQAFASGPVSLETGPYPGGTEDPNSRQYWVTWVGDVGESPAMVESMAFSSSNTYPTIIKISWTGVSSTIQGVNVYRAMLDGSTPRFLTFIPRGTPSFVDDRPDALLGYPIPLNVGYPSSFRTMELFEDRMFAVGGYGDRNRVSCSEVGYPDMWPPLNVIPFPGGRNEEITELRSVSGNLYLFTKTSLYRLRGSGVENYTFDLVSPRVGCVARATMAPWEDGVVFLSTDGVYFFNGSRLTLMSDALEGLFRRQTPGAWSWEKAVGAVRGDHYLLSYLESDETAFTNGGSALTQSAQNRVLVFNLKNGRVGVRNELAFSASCQVRGVEALVVYPSYLSSTTTFNVGLVSDHPGLEFGNATAGIQDDTNVFLSDLNFGDADRVKVLDLVEVEYEAPLEFTVIATAYRSYPIGDTGTTTGEAVTVSGFYPVGTAVYGLSWAGSYAMNHVRRALFFFTMTQGKSFNIGFQFGSNGLEFRLHRITFRYHVEKDAWKGSNVLSGS
jgi:hypothetical protein